MLAKSSSDPENSQPPGPQTPIKAFQPILTRILIGILIALALYLGFVFYNDLKPATIYIHPGTAREIFQQDCAGMVYDQNGKGYPRDIYNKINYIGPAPLYTLAPDLVGAQQVPGGCYKYPKTITPNLLTQGTPVYPILITGEFRAPNNRILVGESVSLVFRAKVMADFTNDTWAVDLYPGKRAFITFHLFAPNFEYQPDETQVSPVAVATTLEAEHTWIVTPVEHANGPQIMEINTTGDKFFARTDINLEVRQLLGINPFWMALTSLVATIITTVIDLLVKLFGLRKELQAPTVSSTDASKKAAQGTQS